MSIQSIIDIKNGDLNETIKSDIIKILLNNCTIDTLISMYMKNIEILFEHMDNIDKQLLQELFAYILHKTKIIENTSQHKLVEKLLDYYDIYYYSDLYGNGFIQMLKQPIFIFNMFYNKYPNLMDIKNKHNYTIYDYLNIRTSDELFTHILNTVKNIDYDKLKSKTTSDNRLKIIMTKQCELSKQPSDEMVAKCKKLRESYNVITQQMNDFMKLFDEIYQITNDQTN